MNINKGRAVASQKGVKNRWVVFHKDVSAEKDAIDLTVKVCRDTAHSFLINLA